MAKLPCDEVSVAKLLWRSYHVAKLLATTDSTHSFLSMSAVKFFLISCCFANRFTGQVSDTRFLADVLQPRLVVQAVVFRLSIQPKIITSKSYLKLQFGVFRIGFGAVHIQVANAFAWNV